MSELKELHPTQISTGLVRQPSSDKNQLKEHQIKLDPIIDHNDALLVLVEAVYDSSPAVSDDAGQYIGYESSLPEYKAQALIDAAKDQDLEDGVLVSITYAYSRSVNVKIKDDGEGKVGLYDSQTNQPLESKRATRILQDAAAGLEILLGKHEADKEKSHEPIEKQIALLVNMAKERFAGVSPVIKKTSLRDDYSNPETIPSLDDVFDWMFEVHDWVQVENPKHPNTLRGTMPNGDTAFITPYLYPTNQAMTAQRSITDENYDDMVPTTVEYINMSLNRGSTSYMTVECRGGYELVYRVEPKKVASNEVLTE